MNQYSADDTENAEIAGLAKTVNYSNKIIVDVCDHYRVGDVLNGNEIRGLSKPFMVVETIDMRMEGGEENERINVQKQYAYFN